MRSRFIVTRLEQLQKLKEQEFKEKFEKEQIKRAVKDLDKDKIVAIKKEKEIEQERLAQEMNLVSKREKELREELNRLDGNIRETQKIYEENERKTVNPAQVAQQISDQENMRRRMFEEKTERIANLKARQNNLYAERNLIDKMQTDLRDGNMPDREEAAKLHERVNMNAQRHLEDIRGVQNFNPENFKKQNQDNKQSNNNHKFNEQFTFGKEQSQQYDPTMDSNGGHQQERDMSQMNRPMSRKALIGQNIVNSRFDQNEGAYNPGLSPTIGVLQNRDLENQRLRDQIDQLTNLLNDPQTAPNYSTTQFNHQNSNPALDNRAQVRRPENQISQPIYPPPQRVQNQPQQFSFGAQGPQPVFQNAQPRPQMPIALPPRGGPKDFDDFLTSNFMQNQMKNVDLNEDERMLVHFTMMEADALRILERIPHSSELYRFKLEQYKELSTQRAEAEKLVQESRLKKMKRVLEIRAKEEDRKFENQRFLDDVRKQDIAGKLAKEGKIPRIEQVPVSEGLRDLNPQPDMKRNVAGGGGRVAAEGEYNIDHGFVIHWDYVFGIPKNKKFCQLVYAIMNGDEAILEPQVVDPRPVQDQNTQKNQCIIYENNHVREIEPNKLSNLIIEVQMPTSANNVEEYTSLGWTFINLFDISLQLNRGKYKLPLYQPPIYRNVNADAIDQLRPVMDCAILFRISYPWKDEFSNLKNLEPHLNHRDYLIPSLHIKQASIPGVLASNLFGATGQKQAQKKQALQQSFANQSEDEDTGDDRVVGLPPQINQRRQPSRDGGAPSTTTKPETPHDMVARSKGIRVDFSNKGHHPQCTQYKSTRKSKGRYPNNEQSVHTER